MPLLWSVTEDRDPVVVDKVTVPWLEVSLLPLASSAWTVIVEVEVPLAVIEVGLAEIVVVEPEAAPGVKVT